METIRRRAELECEIAALVERIEARERFAADDDRPPELEQVRTGIFVRFWRAIAAIFRKRAQRKAEVNLEVLPEGAPLSALRARLVDLRNERSALAGLKTINYGENVVALRLAGADGADEALFGNTGDKLCEGTWSNVFLYRDGTWRTPPLTSGCLPGVTRALVLELFRELGVPVKDVVIPLSELPFSEAAFLTSSLREIQPVSAIDGRELPEPSDLPRLRAAFAARVTRETGRPAT
jgi:branched-subunit amino acid aminotransferase/4-amino-4-deoxychorismate lyase